MKGGLKLEQSLKCHRGLAPENSDMWRHADFRLCSCHDCLACTYTPSSTFHPAASFAYK